MIRPDEALNQALQVNSSCRYAQIEVGGRFVGIEMHHSSPLLNRISFFYPVANSIDLSTDYWYRDQSRVMFLGLKVGNKPKEWIGLEPFDYELTPYSVNFHKRDDERIIKVTYEFCQGKPAMVAKIEITNNSAEAELFEVYTHLELSLRTSHTYTLKDKAWTEFDGKRATVYANFDDHETGNAQVFVANAGEQPISFTTNSETIGLPVTDKNWWMNNTANLPGEIIGRATLKRPAAAFIYRKNLAPRQKMTIIQIIGSCRSDEGRDMVSYLLDHHEQEIAAYKESVLNKAYRDGVMETGDSSIDHSVRWAKAILAANAHYLDGEIVPMPCPAEYNFFFTHDVLLTDLAAVYFDVARVKKDLEYIVRHANPDGIIPHAYYWKDGHYVTEFAPPTDWLHLWFVIVSASYLRHSQDVETLKRLYPFVARSIEQATINKEENLIWAYYPDWWDLGRSFGPRSYMTILAIRALREFVYISVVLGQNTFELPQYEDLASRMQKQLNEKLWDEELNYLINFYEDGNVDKHIYIGPLLAAHFDLLKRDRMTALVQTAKRNLLDEKLGIRNVFPANFHLLIDYLKIKGNEAGDPFVYLNGGIWPHGNAWYALALISIGEKAEALRFIKKTMTLEGIIDSPNGQPAMYEYRNGNKQDPSVYGKVDKPHFLWAAGWYLYCLYQVFGIRENGWNITFDPYLLEGQTKSRYSLFAGGRSVTVTVTGSGRHIKSIEYGDTIYPSAVIPKESPIGEEIEIVLGPPELPYIACTSSILLSSHFDEKEKILVLNLKAFPSHKNETEIISPWKPKAVFINGMKLGEGWSWQQNEDIYQISIRFSHQSSRDTIVVQF